MNAIRPNAERNYYRLVPRVLPKYNHWLVHGSVRRNPATKQLELERIGPYAPPILFPSKGLILVSSSVKNNLVESHLTGVNFIAVVKKRVVHHAWRVGDPWVVTEYKADEIPILAAHVEQSARLDSIMNQPHSTVASAAIGDYWELKVQESSTHERRNSSGQYFLSNITGKLGDMFQPHGSESIYLSPEGHNWMSTTLGKWVDFELVFSRDPAA